jgi:hypothetical protein
MPKYLNIDDFAPEKKILTIAGVEHVMHQVTVQEFVELMRDNKDEPTMEELPVDERVMKLVDQIQKAFPTVPTSELTALSIEQLTAIIQFVMGTLEEEAQAKAKAQGGKEKN